MAKKPEYRYRITVSRYVQKFDKTVIAEEIKQMTEEDAADLVKRAEASGCAIETERLM